MKKIFLSVIAIMLFGMANAQTITDKTSKGVSLGMDLFTDILTKTPADYNQRVINQGFSLFLTYDFKIANGPHVFAIGTGIRTHNFYSDNRIANIKADTIQFVPISSDLNYNRSKINLIYLDFPAEFRFRIDDKWKVGLGFKMGIAVDSKEKYVGKLEKEGEKTTVKHKRINSLEKYTFGPTLRVGYKWINVFAFYQPTRVFQRDLGPEFYPLSVGITVAPF